MGGLPAGILDIQAREEGAQENMRIPGWLRRAVADFFCMSTDEPDPEAERAREELDGLRSLTMLAAAQARRTELELQDVLADDPPDSARLAELVPRLEEQRARADNLMEQYRRRESEEEERLSRLGQLQMAEEMNERRRELREEVSQAALIAREEQLQRMEDEARAEAYSLDVVNRLDAGDPGDIQRGSDAADRDLAERARILLEQSDGETGANE